MKNLITKFNKTGNCLVDVDKVSETWNNNFSISRWHDEFTLVKQGEGESCAKISISKEEAEQIIEKLELLPIQSGMFRHAKTYRSESNILSEKERINKLLLEKENEALFLRSVLDQFDHALRYRISK